MLRVMVVGSLNGLGREAENLFSEASGVRVIAWARGREDAVRWNRTLCPQVILMAIDTPLSVGLELLRETVLSRPVPVLALTLGGILDGEEAGMEALKAGAMDVMRLEENQAWDRVEAEIVQRLKRVSRVLPIRRRRQTGAGALRAPVKTSSSPGGRVVAIGASTGGPAALSVVLKGLPRSLSASVLVVQHIAAGFVSGLVTWLQKESPQLDIKLAEDGEALSEGTVYFPTDDHHIGVSSGGTIVLTRDPPVGGHRPSVDYLMAAVASVYRSQAVGVLLTGMGSDGAEGLLKIREAGGRTIVQDEATSLVFGMPKQAMGLDAVETVSPIHELADRILGALEK